MLRLSEIIKATDGLSNTKSRDVVFKSISTDSRKISKGGLFIALQGPKFDGHSYVRDALSSGALGAVVSKTTKEFPKDKIIIHVKDTLCALHDIAAFYRRKFPVKIIGVTGSSGKTTTKDMISSVLSAKGPTIKTRENLNNEIGVPLTILEIKDECKFAVIEMGMQRPGEIRQLSQIVKPDISVITNIGEAHIQRLKTKRSIAAEKAEILEYLDKNGIAILNSDDKYFGFLKKSAKDKKIISFGIKKDADVSAENIKESSACVSFDLVYNNRRIKIYVPLPGLHNVYNALSAAAAGLALKVPPDMIKKGIFDFKPSSKRMNISTTKNGIRIIDDTYNANPSSMRAALKVLASQGPVVGQKAPRKIAVIGDMLELGRAAKQAHIKIGKLIASSGIEIVMAVGNLARYYTKAKTKEFSRGTRSCASFCYKNNSSAVKKLKKIVHPNDVILLKASRGMKLEEISEKILDNDI